MTDSPKITHQIKAAAAFVVRSAGAGQLFYKGAPVPADATNLDQLIEGDFVEPIGEDGFSAHPSDLPPDPSASTTRRPRQSAAEKKAAADAAKAQAAQDAADKAAADAAAAEAAKQAGGA